MNTATKLQFITAYRELGRIPTELVADYVTVKWMESGLTFEAATIASNMFVRDYLRWLQACTLDELFHKLGASVDAYILLKEEGLYDDF